MTCFNLVFLQFNSFGYLLAAYQTVHKYLTVDDREGIETKAGIELWEKEKKWYNSSEKMINHSTHCFFVFF